MRLILLLLCLSISFQANSSAKSKYPVPYGMSDVECLAHNIYFEARSETTNYRKAAVGFVTLERTYSKHWPNTVCKVVYQQRYSKRFKKWIPMYSWTKDGNSDIPIHLKLYSKCLKIATWVLNGTISDKTKRATHYHNTSVHPYWANSMIKTVQLGNHIFYR